MNGNIPLIAIQLNAFVIDDIITLCFTRVLDEANVNYEDDDKLIIVDRSYWEKKTTKEILELTNEIEKLLKQINSDIFLNMTQSFLGIRIRNIVNNFITFYPKQDFIRVSIKLNDPEKWKDKLEKNNIDTISISKGMRLKFRLNRAILNNNGKMFTELFEESYNNWME